MTKIEHMNAAVETAQLTLNHLRAAMESATPIEALFISKYIDQCATLRFELGALAGAVMVNARPEQEKVIV